MFLDLLRRRNPGFLQAAASLHRAGGLPANSTVIDLDAVERNTAVIDREARRLGLQAFAMTKQIGRNPDAIGAIRAGGIGHAVGVDLECAIAAAAGGLATGHLGHLVQIPRHRADDAAALHPLYWTVFGEEQARAAGAAALRQERVQDVLVRIAAAGDRFYRGHEGGLPADDVVGIADRIDAIAGVRFAGVTSFPATLFDVESGQARTTPNLATLEGAKRALEAAGRTEVQLNAPGTTSASVLAALADAGATQVEPGHGLTGTTPLHAVRDLEETPAVAYVTEVSHLWDGSAYVYGGGLYVDPVLGAQPTRALVIPKGASIDEALALEVEMPAAEAIDYYAVIPLDGRAVEPGDTVIFGFRPQVFVTRSLTVGISGVDGSPAARPAWSADGSRPISVDEALAGLRRRS